MLGKLRHETWDFPYGGKLLERVKDERGFTRSTNLKAMRRLSDHAVEVSQCIVSHSK